MILLCHSLSLQVPSFHIIGISSLLFRVKKKDSEEEKEGNEEDRESRDLEARDLHDTRDFRDPRDLRCFICGDAGHVRRECPEVKLARQRNSNVAAAQLVRNLVNAQQVAGSGQPQGDQPIRTRQSSECVSRKPGDECILTALEQYL